MTNNYTPEIKQELQRLGYELLRDSKHGEIWRKPHHLVTVPYVVKTRKIANNLIRKANGCAP